MTEPARLRDSTQIQVPEDTLEGIVEELQARFAVTVRREERPVRIIGSPVVIKDVSEYLVRNGVSVA